MSNDSGILSLGGFAYQIRVFVFYMSKMSDGFQVEFETMEDVVLNNENIDENSNSFRSLLKNRGDYTAIQVKRTKINKESKEKILLNWLLLEIEKSKNIAQYTLFTDYESNNKDDLFDSISKKEFFDKINNTTKKKNSLILQVKECYKGNYQDFLEMFENIKKKYSFTPEKDLNDKIKKGFSIHFHKKGLSILKYNLRIEELVRDINNEILESVDKKTSYVCKHKYMMRKIEDICKRISEDVYMPDFSVFKKGSMIDLADSGIINSREYLQLKACEISNTRIKDHLVFQQYYNDIRYRNLSFYKSELVENIESTAHDNFCDVKDELESNSKDTPLNRFLQTKKKANSYCGNDQIRKGVYIHLTESSVEDELQISWEDEE